MKYNHLGKAGIKVSALSFGSWITFSNQLDQKNVKECMHYAFDHGVNFFDNAEAYAQGQSEILMGEAIKDYQRSDLVVSTKLFWGGEGPNDKGLCRKHLMEGINNSLKHMQLDYVDLLFCHRPDPETPMEEVVFAMNDIVRSGKAFYWGTSEWSADEISQAYEIAKQSNSIPPSMEQPQYNMFHRTRVEDEYAPLYKKYGMGTTIWSPLASGVLTGKYNQGIPANSRFGLYQQWIPEDFEQRVEKTKRLTTIAEEIGGSMTNLALAWCLKNPNVSTVILGASKIEQLKENLKSLEIVEKLDDAVMKAISGILNG